MLVTRSRAGSGVLTLTEITFHDPCYLGRHNDVYVAPREVVAATGASLVEMERQRTENLEEDDGHEQHQAQEGQERAIGPR